jgi:hypothetical protein
MTQFARTGWDGASKFTFLIFTIRSSASAFLLFAKIQNRKFSFPFLKKFGRATSKKCRENFSVLGRKLLQSLRAEAGRGGN